MNLSGLLDSYRANPWSHRIGRAGPSRDQVAAICDLLLEILFPGYFAHATGDAESYTSGLVLALRARLSTQCAPDKVEGFLAAIAEIRSLVLTDVHAAFEADPAARSLEEVILAYPGLIAIAIHRCAHVLWVEGVPLVPRMMSEWAHAHTGTDIHPGARIGPWFFLDHGTGCVIGETTEIGRRAHLFQGVTLGALSFPRDASGAIIRGQKRHPTLGDNVTVYANATILGGSTVIGSGVTVGASAWITASVPDGYRVALKPPELRVTLPDDEALAFDI